MVIITFNISKNLIEIITPNSPRIIIIIIIPYIYIAFFLVLKSLYIVGGNLLVHHQCAAFTWMMRRQPYCARTPNTHTPVMKPISV